AVRDSERAVRHDETAVGAAPPAARRSLAAVRSEDPAVRTSVLVVGTEEPALRLAKPGLGHPPRAARVVEAAVGHGNAEGLTVREAIEKRLRLPRRVHRVVTVPAQLHVDSVRVIDLTQGTEHVREIDLAFAEHEVVVDAALHVLDVDVPEHVLPFLDVL